MPTVFERLTAFLDEHHATYGVIRHEPVFTSEEAARVRGTPLQSGAKALVVKAGDNVVMLVLPADRKLDSKKARDALHAKNIRFATKEEVLEKTGLTPGSIPPFGSLFTLPTYCDPALDENPSINFNAGDHAISVQMALSEYLRVENPRRASLT